MLRDFPGVGTWVQSLVGKLRSFMHVACPKEKNHKERVFAILLYFCIKQGEDIFKEYNYI